MIEKYLIKEVQHLVQVERTARRQEHRDRRGGRGYDYDDYDDDNDDLRPFEPDVLLVKDDVARLFGSSTHAKKMFPEILPGGGIGYMSLPDLCRIH